MTSLLRIDLHTRETAVEVLAEEFVREYLGGKGIGSHILLEEVPPATDPLGPANKLIFGIGPLAGSSMHGTNRYAVYFLSPLTGGYGEAYSGGRVASQMAQTGYQFVILEGKASSPVYIEVTDEGAAIHPADDLWGLDTYEAEERILARTSASRAQACVIGPSGERLVRFASIMTSHTHALGRGGSGAVMGSKNVKGIVFHGAKKPKLAEPEEFRSLVKEMAERGKGHPDPIGYSKGGTVNSVRSLNLVSMFPARYWTRGHLDDYEPLTAEFMLDNYKIGNSTCPPCFFNCGHVCRVTDGEFAGLEVDGPEFETIYAFGGLCEIISFPRIMLLNDICDRWGIDTITAGNLCGLAIEASRRGLIREKLDFGDEEGVTQFLLKIASREGIGDLFAEGVLTVEKELGLEGVAVHVKGLEPAGIDPRGSKGMALGYIMSSRGACHMRASFVRAELSGLIPADAVEGKAALYVDWENRFALMDCMIFCRFYRELLDWDFLTRIVNAALGFGYTSQDLARIANQIITETHQFNEERGFGPEKEKLPKWITQQPIKRRDGTEATISDEQLEFMRRDYYAVRGWGTPPG